MEVLVAITLLLMVIVGPMQILTRANHSTAYATEQLTAWFLAQEGLEMAQQARDGYLLQYFNNSVPDPWAKFTSTAASGKYAKCFTAKGCDITIDSSGVATVTDCSQNGNKACQLYLLPNGRNRYQHTSTGAELQPFTRVITMQETGVGSEVAATSTITWRTGSLIAGQTVVETTSLFNIYDTP